MTRPAYESETLTNPVDTYRCWSIAISMLREKSVRSGIEPPVDSREERWAKEGPRPEADLETVHYQEDAA